MSISAPLGKFSYLCTTCMYNRGVHIEELLEFFMVLVGNDKNGLQLIFWTSHQEGIIDQACTYQIVSW